MGKKIFIYLQRICSSEQVLLLWRISAARTCKVPIKPKGVFQTIPLETSKLNTEKSFLSQRVFPKLFPLQQVYRKKSQQTFSISAFI